MAEEPLNWRDRTWGKNFFGVGNPRNVTGGAGAAPPLTYVPPDVAMERAKSFGTQQGPLTSAETGRVTGITKGAQTFLGLSPSEAQTIAEGPQPKPEQFDQDLLNRIGEMNPEILKQIAEGNIDWEQVAGAATIKNLPTIGRHAATGATGGFVAGGGFTPAGLALGALGGVVGTASGIYTGVIKNIEDQQKGEIGASKDELSLGRSNMRQLSMAATQDPANADYYITLYNNQLTRIKVAEENIKLEVDGFFDKSFEDGTDTLSDFEIFLRDGGLAEVYGRRLQIALSQGSELTPLDYEFDDVDFPIIKANG